MLTFLTMFDVKLINLVRFVDSPGLLLKVKYPA